MKLFLVICLFLSGGFTIVRGPNDDFRITPIDRARMGLQNDIQSRITSLETQAQQNSQADVSAQSQSEVSLDIDNVNTNFAYVNSLRLSASDVDPNPDNSTTSPTLFLYPYLGTEIGIWNGGLWEKLNWLNRDNGGNVRVTNNLNGTTLSGSAVITALTEVTGQGSIPQLNVGMEIIGTGIPDDTYITSIDSPTQITLTRNATASANVPISAHIPVGMMFDVYAVDSGNGVLSLRTVPYQGTPPAAQVITNATNATPIVITTTSVPATGSIVVIQFVNGNTAANGVFRVGTTTATTFQLLTKAGANVAGSGAYTSGGRWTALSGAASTPPQIPVRLYSNFPDVNSGGVWTLNNGTYRYLGTCRVNSTSGRVEDSPTFRGVWNYYNRLRKRLQVSDGTATWTITTAAGWQADRNDYTNRVEFVIGPVFTVTEDPVIVRKYESITGGAGAVALSGLSLDTVAAPTFFNSINAAATTRGTISNEFISNSLTTGYHWVQGMEETTGANSIGIGNGQHNIVGELFG